MFHHFRISLFIPPLLVFLTGCVDMQGTGDQPIGAPGRVSALPPAPARPDGRLRADIESLGKNLSALRRGLANQEGRIEKVRKALQSLTDRIEKNRAGTDVVSKNFNDRIKELKGRLDAVDSEFAILRSSRDRGFAEPEKEEPEEEIRPAGVPAPKEAPGSAQQGSGGEAGAAGAPQQVPPDGAPQVSPQDIAAAVPPAGAPAPVEIPTPPPPPDPEADYNEGLRVFKEERSFLKARELFHRFILNNPTNELADDAQYWIGESFFEEKNYERAILAFNKVQVDYANGDKAPDALLKEALAFLSLGDKASARELLGRVVKKYPESEAARAASEHLKSL
jgi:tol-pal system protein YbgF